jgi:cystathionine beta-synthase
MAAEGDWGYPHHSKAQGAADMKKEEGPTKCGWKEGVSPKPSPHAIQPSPGGKLVYDTILEHIGNTPMVRINRIGKSEGIQCEILAKCEFFNAGGSVKDRIGKRMVEDAEKSGRIKPGDCLIEPTSGNTGIGLALSAALKGYRMIITLPEKMSNEKVDILKGLGAEIWRTPTEAAFDSPESHIGVAKRLNAEIKNSHILDQYSNPSNPLAHYDGTAEEILKQCGGKLDAVVLTAGTGGTLTGVARKLREKLPHVKIVGVDPHGSILALPETLNGAVSSYKVEGIGYDFIPKVLDRSLVDQWIKTEDKESFVMAKRLIREEGLLVGGSSGSAMVAAIKYAKSEMKAGQRLVVLLPDSVRNYMSKFLSDNWMVDNGFMEPREEISGEWWSKHTVADLKLRAPLTVSPDVSCAECISILKQEGYDQMPVVNASGEVEGMATMANITSQITRGRVKPEDSVSKVLYRQFKKIPLSTSLGVLSKMFDTDHFVLVVSEKTVVFGLATRIDLLDYIVKAKGEYPAPQSPSVDGPARSSAPAPAASAAGSSSGSSSSSSSSSSNGDSTPAKKRHGECPVDHASDSAKKRKS